MLDCDSHLRGIRKFSPLIGFLDAEPLHELLSQG
jgi:hypothetical protein